MKNGSRNINIQIIEVTEDEEKYREWNISRNNSRLEKVAKPQSINTST